MKQMNENSNLDKLINAIFFFGIKYYNCYEKLNDLIKQIKAKKIDNSERFKKFIKDNRESEDFKLFTSFYEASLKIYFKFRYYKQSNNIDSNFDEAKNIYIEENYKKIKFLYDNVIPCDDETVEKNNLIIKKFLEIIGNSKIDISKIKDYSRNQTNIARIKQIELSIINNLLLNLNNENNIILVLNYIHKKIRNENNLLNSVFDNIYGADYFEMEILKHKFHSFLNIIRYKLTNKQQNYSIITQISLIESLIWKIRKRNFSALIKIIELFKEIKYDTFELKEDYYNIKIYDKKKLLRLKIEIFKILVNQIIIIIKEFLEFKEKNENNLKIERTPSTFNEEDLKNVTKEIMSYFTEIKNDSPYFDDIILFFYKIINNSHIFFNYFLKNIENYREMIKKIINLSFNIDENNYKTKIIMIKLFCQIIENINKDNKYLLKYLPIIDKLSKNPLISYYKKILEVLNNKYLEEKSIHKYYMDLLYICLNKLALEDENIIKDIINDVIFRNNDYFYICENEFVIKQGNSNIFKDITLFNSPNDKSIKKGKILLFLSNEFKEYINFLKMDIDNNKYRHYFSGMNNYIYSCNNLSNVLTIYKEEYQSGFYSILNIELKNISDFDIINSENKYQIVFFKKNEKLITDKIIEELKKDELNDKGIFLLLKILSQIIKYMDKKDLNIILKYLCKFYNNKKTEENNYPFMSFEYILNKINICFKHINSKNIKKERESNFKLYSLFNYIICKENFVINRNYDFFNNMTFSLKKVDDRKINEIYNKNYELSNLSFYLSDDGDSYKIINENSLLFYKPILNDNDLLDLSTIVKKNNNKIKVIIVNEISDNINKEILSEFINNNEIPIYILSQNNFQIIIDFFLKGIGANYIFLYNNNDHYQCFEENKTNLFYIFKSKLNNSSNASNNKKTENNCNSPSFFGNLFMNHNIKKEEVKENKLEKYKNNIDKIYKEIKEESKDLFNILNIKLCKRLIIAILCLEGFELIEEVNIFEDVTYIYETLCLEYYFNSKYNIYNGTLKKKILYYFQILSNKKDKAFSGNKWLLYFFEQLKEIDFDKQIFKLDDLDLKNKNTEKQLYEKFKCGINILYDKLLLIEIYNKENNNEEFIKYYFSIIYKILNHNKNLLFIDSLYRSIQEDNYENEILSKIINILYNYYYKTLTYNNIGNILDIPNNIHEIMEQFFEIDIYEHLKKGVLLEGNDSEIIKYKKKAIIMEWIFKYYDICLFLLFKKDLTIFINYMINPDNISFKQYIKYKILTMKKNDKREINAFIYYLVELISENTGINEINSNQNIFEMIVNHINEYKFKYNTNFYEISLQQVNNEETNYNKIIVLCFDDKTKKYYFRDIIDFKDHSKYDNKLKVNSNLYFIPVKNIETCLYSIENNDNSFKFTKWQYIPKYSWNVLYDGEKYLFLSEKDNKIYNFNEQEGSFNIKEELTNNIIDYIEGNNNFSTFLYMKNGDIKILDDNNIEKYTWLKSGAIINIPNVQIKNVSANYNECYVIGKDGYLYENKGQGFIKVDLPENTTKFLNCACGEGYVICIIQNNEGKGVLYAKGKNNNNQCGIKNSEISKELDVQTLKKCEVNENLDFKYIITCKGFSAALTSKGKLYVWGIREDRLNPFSNLLIKKPTLINKDDKIIIDKISLNNKDLYAIGRKLEDEKFIKKLFILEKTMFVFDLKEIKIIEENEEIFSRIIPIKIFIGKFRTYCLCINEGKLIEDIKQNDNKNIIENNVKIIIKDNIEDNKKKLLKIYNSDKLNMFIESFNLIPDTNIKELRNALNDLAMQNIKINDIEYNELITYLIDKENLKDLCSFFLDNEKKEGKTLFNYLKTRISLLKENITNYLIINNNLNSEGLIENIIEQNNIFSNEFFSVILEIMIKSQKFNNHFDQNAAFGKVTIDRFKAKNFKEKFKTNKKSDINLSETEFGQLFSNLVYLPGNDFIKNKKVRLFYVGLVNEGAIDDGGPYREIISDICQELHSDYIELFIRTPNNEVNDGDLRDKYIFNPKCNKDIHKSAFEFIGKLMILAISSGETLDFNLHPIIWKNLSGKKITFEDYIKIDINCYNIIEELKKYLLGKDIDSIQKNIDGFAVKSLGGKEFNLKEYAEENEITLNNVESFINLVESFILKEIETPINYIKNILYSTIGKNLLQLLTGKQLEIMVCGNPTFDIKNFKEKTKYYIGEDDLDLDYLSDNDKKVIGWFWQWLEECNEERQFKYLKFVSGRSRLYGENYEYTHIIKLYGDDINNNDGRFPKAETCYFTLHLPRYTSKEILSKRLNTALDNSKIISDE